MLNGVFNVTHAFLDQLRATKGRVINIGSIQSFMHVRTPNSLAYTTSKHGVLGFTKALAAELGKDGVRVNAIGPGWVKTDVTAALQADPERYNAITARIPLGRWAEPDDLAGTAVFLASDASDYITGQVIFVDGGWLAF